jgi:hypothetical protein
MASGGVVAIAVIAALLVLGLIAAAAWHYRRTHRNTNYQPMLRESIFDASTTSSYEPPELPTMLPPGWSEHVTRMCNVAYHLFPLCCHYLCRTVPCVCSHLTTCCSQSCLYLVLPCHSRWKHLLLQQCYRHVCTLSFHSCHNTKYAYILCPCDFTHHNSLLFLVLLVLLFSCSSTSTKTVPNGLVQCKPTQPNSYIPLYINLSICLSTTYHIYQFY